jgi:hypothetical protein
METTNSTALEVTIDPKTGKRNVKKITLTGVVGKPRAKLATGVTAKTAPNSAKAVADAKPKAEPKAPAKGKPKADPKAPAKGKAKAEPKAKADPNADRKYKALMTFEQTKVRPGTWTTFMVQTILAHTSTAKASEASRAQREREYKFPNGNPKPLDFGWAEKRGFIQFVK